MVKNHAKSTWSIARLVSVWSDSSDKSFFGDLIKSYRNNTLIKPREGDSIVISYSNIFDICVLLGYIANNRILGVINVSTGQYDSRANLKAFVNNKNCISIEGIKGHRIMSNIINWKDILDSRSKLF